jgi:fatty acid desaturase
MAVQEIILPRKKGLFRYSNWDVVPVMLAFVHLAYLIGLYFGFTRVHLPWGAKIPLMGLLGFVYSVSISWNINGISHNFIHNRYFNSPVLNRAFSILESVCCLFSQVLYDCVHRRHHMGNADRPNDVGQTVDWISIYAHGHGGHAENVWSYFFCQFFRDEPRRAYREVAKHSPADAKWGIIEMAIIGVCMVGGFLLNWKFMIYLLPFWYLGHCLSNLNGYFEHFGGNPDVPMAWGVSSYHRLYNLVWFNNGYHQEHHYRPQVHWTRLPELTPLLPPETERRVVRGAHWFNLDFGRRLADATRRPLRPNHKSPTRQ